MEFKVGDRVTWSKCPWYGVGTVILPTYLKAGQVAVRFDGYGGYTDEAGEPLDHHTPYAEHLTLVTGGRTPEKIQEAAFKHTEDSFALSKAWDEKVTSVEDLLEPPPTGFTQEVNDVLTEVGRMLLKKNESYGDAALNPSRIFSRADSSEQIRVRLDDKLSRLQRGNTYEDDDDILDIMGYLVLLKIAEGK